MGRTTIIIIVVVAAVIFLLAMIGRSAAKKAEQIAANGGTKEGTKGGVRELKTEDSIIKDLMAQGYNQTEAEQIATSQLLASGHDF